MDGVGGEDDWIVTGIWKDFKFELVQLVWVFGIWYIGTCTSLCQSLYRKNNVILQSIYREYNHHWYKPPSIHSVHPLKRNGESR